MDRRVRRTLDLLKQGYSAIPLETLASAAGVSSSRLEHLFKMCVGQSIREFVRTSRLVRAAELIIESDRPISEVMRSAGFTDHSNFDHAFKRHFGITPSNYRRLVQDSETQQLRPKY